MGHLEGMPLVTIDHAVFILINSIEHRFGGIGEALLEFIPGNGIVAVGVQFMKMDHVGAGVGH